MDATKTPPRTIDADVHNVVSSVEVLLPYLAVHWQEYIAQTAFKGPTENPYPPHAPTSVRPDLRDATEGTVGSTLQQLREHLLDPSGVALAILNCTYAIESIHNPDAAAALASAVNDWQITEWLDQEPRLRASIVVPYEDGDLAAESDRMSADKRFVQVLLLAHSRTARQAPLLEDL